MDIAPERNSPDKQQKECNANGAVHQVEDDLLSENRARLFQFRRRQQWDELVHENKESHGEDDVYSGEPAADFEFLALFFRLDAIKRDVRGETKGAKTQAHGVTKRHYTSNHRPSHPFVFF
jgi:hypothetical protein